VNSPEIARYSQKKQRNLERPNSHDGSLARAVPTKQTRHFTLAELQCKIVYSYDIPPLTVVDLPDAVEFHSDLLLGNRQATGVAVVICVRQDIALSSIE